MAGRAALVIGVGVGLWLALRWAVNVPPAPEPALERFLADGGGGAIEVWGVYAPEEYFRLTQRDAAKLNLDPARERIFLLLVDTHEHDEDLPGPTTWWDDVFLRVNGEGHYTPLKKMLVLDSEHHQTIAVAFPREEGKKPRAGDKGTLELVVPNLSGTRTMEWRLPLVEGTPPAFPRSLSPLSLTALLPALAGLLVAFSPCLVHMTTYYIPLFGGVAQQKVAGARGRIRTGSVAVLFALGFAIPYTVAGVAVGYAGRFVKDSSSLSLLSQPVAIGAGAVVLFFGLQVAGVFRIPFLMRLNPPRLLSGRRGAAHITSGLLGLNLAVGCLGCVGGSLFASLLLYSGVAGSPVEGGLILLLFALAANAPFFLAAVTLGRFQLRNLLPLSVTRYVPLASGAILIALGLFILSGTESLIEDTLIRALAIQS